jgi:hypothetical protein
MQAPKSPEVIASNPMFNLKIKQEEAEHSKKIKKAVKAQLSCMTGSAVGRLDRPVRHINLPPASLQCNRFKCISSGPKFGTLPRGRLKKRTWFVPEADTISRHQNFFLRLDDPQRCQPHISCFLTSHREALFDIPCLAFRTAVRCTSHICLRRNDQYSLTDTLGTRLFARWFLKNSAISMRTSSA